MNEVRQAVSSVSGSIPIAQERTMQDYYADSLTRTSFTLVLLAIAGGMGLWRLASSGSMATSHTSCRRGAGRSAFGRRLAPSHGT